MSCMYFKRNTLIASILLFYILCKSQRIYFKSGIFILKTRKLAQDVILHLCMQFQVY